MPKYGRSNGVKLITRDTDYAVRAICYIAKKKNNVVSVTELVNELRIPRPFLRKILQKLNKEKILKSHKGIGGGFELSIHPENIFVKDLIEIFQGSFKLNECVFRKKLCPNRGICKLKKRIDSIEDKVFFELKNINIASLIK